jgi:hypothetical protein
MDVDGVRPGQDFVRVLANTLSSTDVMLTVIGPRWIGLRNESGTRRLDEPKDFVATEIMEALTRNVPVVPVLVQGAKMPEPNQLPDNIRALATRQAVVLGSMTWNDDMDALFNYIESVFTALAVSSVDQTIWTRLDQWRRRIVRRTKTWILVKRTAAVLLSLAVLAVTYGAMDFIQHREQRAVDSIARSLRYELPRNLVMDAIDQLQELAGRSSNSTILDNVTAKLKALVLIPTDTTDNGRAIRSHALEAIKTLRLNDLTIDFKDLTKNDLVEANLSRAIMKGMNLSGSFLLRTSFAASDLTGTNLSATLVRNTDFGAATLTGANIAKMDWFNAEGLDLEQLKSAAPNTVERCPKSQAKRPTVAAFRARLDREYAFKWEQMGSDRDQLSKVWEQYATPGGLCDQVDEWLDSR